MINSNNLLFKEDLGDGKMAQSSDSNTHVNGLQLPVTAAPEGPIPFSGLHSYLHLCGPDTERQFKYK